jgi:hypothetical protein
VAAPPSAATSPPRIASARLVDVSAPELGGRDGILVVFTEEVDPATLVPSMLLVVSKAGHRMPPDRALLSPARLGQTRTVLLVGDFTREGREPSDVIVVGRLYTTGGRSLRGVSQGVEPPETPRRVVIAQRLPGDGTRCGGAKQIVRTYWSAPLEPGAPIDREAVRVWLRDGTALVPSGFDTASLDERSGRGSNVLDVCLDADSAAHRLRMGAGILRDAADRPSLEVEIPIGDPPAIAW